VTTEQLPNTDLSDGSYVVSEKHLNGINNNEVWYYEVIGGGHDWPGAWGNMDISAGEEAWLFFQKYIDDTLSTATFTLQNENIRVFPNPASTLLYIEGSMELEIQDVALYSALGVSLKTIYTNGGIDITNLSKGVYLLKVKTSKGTQTKKIVKN
jgi:polyhydroxybutyrate depolymerase